YDELIDLMLGNAGTNGRPTLPSDSLNSAAHYSKLYNINNTAYDTLFNYIGSQIDSSTMLIPVYTFNLAQAPMDPSSVTATLIMVDGTRIPVPSNMISVSLNVVSISSRISTLVGT